MPVPVTVVTTDAEHRAVGLVDPSALAQVPAEVRDSTPLSAVARTVPGDWTVDAAPQEDITRLIEAGEIAGAGLDVTNPEPLPDGHPLYDLPNCTMTPHMAASAHVAQYHLGTIFNANAAAWERGEAMPTRVDAEAGY